MTLSIDGRTLINDCGAENFPAGEIFISPVEDSVNGWVRFTYPLIYRGQVIEDVQLWLEGGRVARFEATSGREFLETMLALDEGTRMIGEFGIGTNRGIDRFTKNMLFDEKMGGMIHIDMLVDMADGAIEVDGRRVYENGRFVD
jgi:aminopeptidase